MAIKAYVGIMGSGKTYEVASVVIYDAIKQGRRVISNIAGLNEAEYYRLAELEGLDVNNLGKILCVKHDDVLKPEFWLTDNIPLLSNPVNLNLIQAGDLVVLDEIWRFWDGFALSDNNGKKRPDSVMNFFRMHRQFVNPATGQTCDVALITQDVADIHRQVKGVIEETYRMTKLTALGLSKRYRVDVFSRTKIIKEPLRSFQRVYDAKFFGLYQSHSQKKEGSADAREINFDKRGNILSGKLFLVVLPLILLMAGFAFYFVWGFFHPEPKGVQNVPISPISSSNSSSVSPAAVSVPIVSDWKIKGYFQNNNVTTLILIHKNGSYRYINDPFIRYAGLDLAAVVDGEVINNWIENDNNNKMIGSN